MLLARATWTAVLAQSHQHPPGVPAAAHGLEFFTPAQAVDIEAIAEQIIPADDTPGAREAGVIRFIDRALSTFDRSKQPVYLDGLKQLGRFASLDAHEQLAKLKFIEKTEFFDLVRSHTIMGFFSNPEYGGNRDKVGWKLIGFEDAFVFKPPFGYYDGPEGGK
jgi:gluconate 2-dehydrogenase gamma chain